MLTLSLTAALAIAAPTGPLQDQIDAASPGAVVLLPAGSYPEDLVLAEGVSVVGAEGGGTILFGRVSSAAVGATLADLTLDGSLSPGAAAGLSVTAGDLNAAGVVVRGFELGVQVTGGAATLDALRVESCGGGAALLGGTALVTNAVVLFPSAEGVTVDGAAATVVNCLVVGAGYALADGAALRALTVATVVNTLLVSSQIGLHCEVGCTTGANLVWGNGVDYSGAALVSADDVALDPRFRDPGEGDFTLLADSPAIDAGQPALAPTLDAAGQPRPQGDGVDIGPFEAAAAPPEAWPIRITEVMANALDEQTGEFIELFNAGAEAVDLGGFVIDDGDSTDVLAAWAGGPTVVAPGGYAVVLDPQYPGGFYDLPLDTTLLTVASSVTLGSGLATTDPITVLAPGGVVVDTFSHPFNAGNGVSVEREDVTEGDVATNWIASPCGASPGAPSCASAPPPPLTEKAWVITEVLANPLDESSGELVEILNVGEVAQDAAGLVLSDGDADDVLVGWQGGPTVVESGQYAVVVDPDFTAQDAPIALGALKLTIASTLRIGNGLSTTDPVVLLTAEGSVLDSFTHPFNAGNGISVERTDPSAPDLPGSWKASVCPVGSSAGAAPCEAPVAPEDLALVITEVMANPYVEDTGEFVEVLNASPEPVDLAGYRLSDGDAEEPLQAFAPGGSAVVPVGGYAVILDAEYGGQYSFGAGAVLLRTPDTTLGSGLATTDPVTLYAPLGAEPLSTYLNPFNPGNGRSAERLDATAPDGPGAWVATPCGATPGAAGCGAPPDPPPVADAAIVITEVMANPLDEDTGEYIELYNAGADPVNLAGFEITDGDATDTLAAFEGGQTALAPGAYAMVVNGDYAGQYPLPPGATIVRVDDSRIGNGLATTDPVHLLVAGALVSGFSFPSNPGNGRSIERVAVDAPDAAESWVVSPCQTALGDAYDHHSPGAPSCAAEPPPDPNPEPGGCGVAITELMYDAKAVSDKDGEWVELQNASDAPVDLQGYTLRDFGSNSWVVGEPLPVGAGAAVVLCANADMASNGGVACDAEWSGFFLSNAADSVVLESPTGAVVDQVSYQGGAPWPDLPAGVALQLLDPCGENDAPGGWIPATAVYGQGDLGTPGAPNTAPGDLYDLDPAVADSQAPALGASLRFAPYDDLEPHVLGVLGSAQSELRLAMYNLRLDSVLAVLEERKAAGVDVHVLLDADAQAAPFNDMDDKLVAAGIPMTLIDNTASPFASMHHKFAVVDGTTVITGTANWTSTALSDNDEAVLTVDDPALAARYLAEWDELATGAADVVSPAYAEGAALRAWMGPEDDLELKALAALDAAQSRVLVAMFELTHPALLAALVEARAAGVIVVCVVDASNLDPADLALLEAGDVTVLQVDNVSSAFADMHLKLAVVDGQTVLVGSFNWTQTGANDSHENLVVVNDAHLAARTEGRFADLFGVYGPLDAGALGLETGTQAVTLTVGNLTPAAGATLEALSLDGAGPLGGGVAVAEAGLTLSLAPGTRLEYRYRVVGPTGASATEGGPRHVFTVPFAPGPFLLSDVFRP